MLMQVWPKPKPVLVAGWTFTATRASPQQIYEEGLWICGRSALPIGSAPPASRASSESGEMLAFGHIPTGAAANKGFNIDDVNR
jgi:hypothetical protein